MQFRRQFIRGWSAALACWFALAVGAAPAQDFEDPTNPFTQDEPLIPPTPYVSPLASVYVQSDLVGFTRLDTSTPYARANRNLTLLSGDSLDYPLVPGWRMMLGMRLGEYYSLETSYLGLFEWEERASVRNSDTNPLGTAGNLSSPFTNFGTPAVVGLDFNNFVSIASQMQFDTAEINVRQRVDLPSSGFQAAGIWGLRYMGVSDRFAYRSRSASPTPAGSTAAFDVNAYNRMFGTQLGGALEMHIERRAWFSMEAKGLLFSNDSSQASHFASGPAAGAATTSAVGDVRQRRVSYGADLQATLCWRFSPAIVGRIGYQAIFLDGLALGEDNFVRNARGATTSPVDLANDGNQTFHGPFSGVTITW
jgi:hypothetical protein